MGPLQPESTTCISRTCRGSICQWAEALRCELSCLSSHCKPTAVAAATAPSRTRSRLPDVQGERWSLLPVHRLVRSAPTFSPIHCPLRARSQRAPCVGPHALQVVGCVVRSCDLSTYPPKLLLSLDVAGGADRSGEGDDKQVGTPTHVCATP